MDEFMNAEIDFFGLFVPWWMGIGIVAYLAAWFVVRMLEHVQLTRFIWHLPLFFLALALVFYSVIGLVFAP